MKIKVYYHQCLFTKNTQKMLSLEKRISDNTRGRLQVYVCVCMLHPGCMDGYWIVIILQLITNIFLPSKLWFYINKIMFFFYKL